VRAKYAALFHRHGLATRDGDEAQSADHGAAEQGGLTSPHACPCPYTKFRPGDVLVDLVVVLVADLDGDGNVELVGER
jgi:hypothetical protein